MGLKQQCGSGFHAQDILLCIEAIDGESEITWIGKFSSGREITWNLYVKIRIFASLHSHQGQYA